MFKEYIMGQMVLLPANLEEEIDRNHQVRVVNQAIEKMNLRKVMEQYKGGGTSSYHPKMMLKVLIYAYTQQIYSSRKIAKALRENIYFMWLSGNSHPDFRTINRFRGEVVKESITEIFTAVLMLLEEAGYVKLENYFVDGTKMEANANKYSFVWAKNTKRYKERVQEKIAELIEKIEKINKAEDEEYGEKDLPERGETVQITAEELEKKIGELNEILQKMSKDEVTGMSAEVARPVGVEEKKEQEPEEMKKEERKQPVMEKKGEKRKRRQKTKAQQLKEGIRQLRDEYLSRLQKYEKQEAILDGRNSYSKTDTDATFMRMKDDLMHNGQLKAGYNIQIGTENQYVIWFSLHQEPGDTSCLISHLDELKQQMKRLPINVIADSGYGSEENYVYLEKEKVSAYVKYNTFHRENKQRYKPNPFVAENMIYDKVNDTFVCPNGKTLRYKTVQRYRTKNGFNSERRIYECEDCSRCPLRQQCTKADGNRQIKVNFRLWQMRAQAKEQLCSEKGKALRAQRSVDVETVFGRIKQNWGFRRFLLRGLEKVRTEWGLLCIANNLSKMALA